jgi:hypothetical protein
LLIASGASDMQVAHQMGHRKIETTKNIYGHLFAWGRAAILGAMNQAVSRLYAYEKPADGDDNTVAEGARPLRGLPGDRNGKICCVRQRTDDQVEPI